MNKITIGIFLIFLFSVRILFASEVPAPVPAPTPTQAPAATPTPIPQPATAATTSLPTLNQQAAADCLLYSQRSYQVYNFKNPEVANEFSDVWDQNTSIITGFSASLFIRPSGDGNKEYVVAFRGTQGITDILGLSTDIKQPFISDPQYMQALRYAQKVIDIAKSDNNASVIFTGHSLGGGLAQFCGLAYGKDAYCFNAAAIGAANIQFLGEKAVTNVSQIHHIVWQGDPVFFGSAMVPGSRQFGSVWLVTPPQEMIAKIDRPLLIHSAPLETSLDNEHLSVGMSFDNARAQNSNFLRDNLPTINSKNEAIGKRDVKEMVEDVGEMLRMPKKKDQHENHGHHDNGGGGNAVVADTDTSGKKSSDSAKGVRIEFDERILAEVLQKGTATENAKLVDELTRSLAAAQNKTQRTQVVTEFETKIKKRFLESREKRLLHDLVSISLKSLVAGAEKYKSNWDKLPADLRNPGLITRIYGFVISGDNILLIGGREPGAPVLDIDDLIVGVQSVWKDNLTPIVSLDPDPANIKGDPNVRIQGVANNSSFALTMLEADYAMKKIMASVDSVDVRGYRTLKDTLKDTSRTFISRFWLYPVQPGAGEIRVSSDTSSAVYDGAVRVLSEEMLNLKEGLVGTGQTYLPAEEASDSFTRFYDQIASQRPVFKRLKLLFDVVLTARIWHVRRLELPLLERLCALPHRIVKIPSTYKAIHVLLRSDASGEYYLQGGVQAKIGAGRRTWLDLDDQSLDSLSQQCQLFSNSGKVSSGLSNIKLNVVAPVVRPDSSSRDFSNAIMNLFKGNLKAALAAADRVLTVDSYDTEALMLRALIYLRGADYEKARADAQRACNIDPGDREIAAAAGQILFQCAWMQGDPDKALNEMEESLKNDLQRASGQISRGEALMLLDRSNEAKNAFLKALKLDPASAVACARLSQLELAHGRLLSAKPWVHKAQNLDADKPEVRVASAQWELATVRPDLAEKIAGEVWGNQASSPTVRIQALAILAAVSASREKWNDVDKYVSRMDELSAHSPEVLVAAAEIAIQWGERERASTYLANAIKLAPNHPLVLKMAVRLAR